MQRYRSEKLHMQDVDFNTAKIRTSNIFGSTNPLTTMHASRCGRREKTQSKTVTEGMQRSGRTCTVYCRVLSCLSDDRYWHQSDMATKLNSIG